MSKEKHTVHLWCAERIAETPKALERAQEFYDNKYKYGELWPDWCGLPMSAVYSIITDGANISRAQSVLMARGGATTLQELTASLLWVKSKAIYQYDPDLAKELLSQPMDDKLPVESIRLPYYCVYIETPIPIFSKTALGMFAWMEFDPHSRLPELRLLFLMDDASTTPCTLALVGGTIDDCIAAVVEKSAQRSKMYNLLGSSLISKVPTYTAQQIAGAVNLVLYLCSEHSDIPNETIRRSTDRYGNPRNARTWDVGIRIGAALRRHKQGGQNSDNAEPTSTSKASPRPHIRRAHWHGFWTGPKKGERELKIRWMPPIPVKMDGAEDMPTVIHLVNKE